MHTGQPAPMGHPLASVAAHMSAVSALMGSAPDVSGLLGSGAAVSALMGSAPDVSGLLGSGAAVSALMGSAPDVSGLLGSGAALEAFALMLPAERRGAMLRALWAALKPRRDEHRAHLARLICKWILALSAPDYSGRLPDPGPPIPRATLCRLALAAPNAPNAARWALAA
jgi:hypothetical protein